MYWWCSIIIMNRFVKNQCFASVTQSRMEWTEVPDFAIVICMP
ncbi:hypothetical protein GBAR_LOCUS24356 [Geodia barretti]|uniref:Uncharacterized protein n=1 Tax=Geodia barretti TaxID=519541 RepID=A0AA35TAI8_GEOBA|nr:hypothetical protein GBAR_LOCUS24356 [Geodia barretti]